MIDLIHSTIASNVYTLSCIKQIVTWKLLNNRVPSLMLYDDLEGWNRWRGGNFRREGIYIIMTGSHCCMAETNTKL